MGYFVLAGLFLHRMKWRVIHFVILLFPWLAKWWLQTHIWHNFSSKWIYPFKESLSNKKIEDCPITTTEFKTVVHVRCFTKCNGCCNNYREIFCMCLLHYFFVLLYVNKFINSRWTSNKTLLLLKLQYPIK